MTERNPRIASLARALGGAYAALMLERGVDGAVAVGRDNRPSGDPLREKCLAPLGGLDLRVQLGDLRLDLGDLRAHVLLLSGVLLKRLLHLFLSGHRVGQVAPELLANLVD